MTVNLFVECATSRLLVKKTPYPIVINYTSPVPSNIRSAKLGYDIDKLEASMTDGYVREVVSSRKLYD